MRMGRLHCGVFNTYWTRHIGGEGSGRPHQPPGPLRGQAGLHRMLVIFNEHRVEYLVIFKAHRNVSNIQGKQRVAELYGAKHVNVHLNYGIVTKAQQLWICKQSTTKPSSGNFKEEREERHASLISLLQSNTPLWLAKAPGFGDKTLQFIKLSNYQIHCNTLIPNTPLMHKYEMQMHKC